LTACRALMGVGGAFIMPSTLSILAQVFREPKQRAQAIGIWAAVAVAGVAIGPVAGGLLLEHFSWHSVFWVNPPLAAAALIFTLIVIPESKDPTRPLLDPLGAVLSSLGLIALVVTIIQLPESGLGVATLSTLLASIVLLSGFVWWEGHARRPLLPMSLFRQRTFVVSIITVALVYFALMGAMFFLPQFLQLVQGMRPLQSGLSILPGAAGLFIASLLSARVAERVGSRNTVLVGLILVTSGMVALGFLTSDAVYPYVGASLAGIGFGLGLTTPQATNGVLSSVPTERAGLGSAVNDGMSELGGSFGVAVLGSMLSVFYRANIDQAVADAGDAITRIPVDVVEGTRESLASATLVVGQAPAEYVETIRTVAAQAFISGMTWALLAGAAITAVGILLAWRLFPEHIEPVSE
jgi:MFS family permease